MPHCQAASADRVCLIMWPGIGQGQSNVWKRLFRRSASISGHFTWQKMTPPQKPLPATHVRAEASIWGRIDVWRRRRKSQNRWATMTRAHYEAETFIENRLNAPLKPIVGTNRGRKWPRFKTNDRKHTPFPHEKQGVDAYDRHFDAIVHLKKGLNKAF